MWNYRILKSKDTNGNVRHAIYEVYYDSDEKPIMWTEEPQLPEHFEEPGNEEDPIKSIKEILLMMLKATIKPVLEIPDEKDSKAGLS